MSAQILPPSRVGDRLEELDKEIKGFASITRKKLLQKLLSLGVNDKVRLARSKHLTKNIRSKLKKKDGEIERVAFTFLRHGIFLEHGVGRGRPVGSTAANQSAKKWLSAVLPGAINDLADLLEEEYADVVVAELNFNIPGIISSKVR